MSSGLPVDILQDDFASYYELWPLPWVLQWCGAQIVSDVGADIGCVADFTFGPAISTKDSGKSISVAESGSLTADVMDGVEQGHAHNSSPLRKLEKREDRIQRNAPEQQEVAR